MNFDIKHIKKIENDRWKLAQILYEQSVDLALISHATDISFDEIKERAEKRSWKQKINYPLWLNNFKNELDKTHHQLFEGEVDKVEKRARAISALLKASDQLFALAERTATMTRQSKKNAIDDDETSLCALKDELERRLTSFIAGNEKKSVHHKPNKRRTDTPSS